MVKHSSQTAPVGPSSGFAIPTPGTAVNPLSLSVEETARMLSAAGGKTVTPEQVQADLDAGAPVGHGGRINLVHYVAWLMKEVQSR